MEIDAANDVTKVNDEENDKKDKKNDVSNAKTNAEDNEVANDERNDSVEIDDESENDQNDTKKIHTDECDEKTKVEAENLYKKEFENVHIVGNNLQPSLI